MTTSGEAEIQGGVEKMARGGGRVGWRAHAADFSAAKAHRLARRRLRTQSVAAIPSRPLRADRSRSASSRSRGAVNRQRYQPEEFDLPRTAPRSRSAQVERRDLSDNGLLSRFGLIEKDDNDNFRLSDLVGDMLSRKRLAAPQIRALLLGNAGGSLRSSWDDFAHLGELRDLAARMVAHRGEGVANAANILIYGPPGTGKSEFVKTLAARLGFSAHFVGERQRPERRAEPARADRRVDDRQRARERRAAR